MRGINYFRQYAQSKAVQLTHKAAIIRTMRGWRHLSSLAPSTIDSGFILSLPKLQNPFTSDAAYQRVLSWYLPEDVLRDLSPRLRSFADEAVSDRVHGWISNAEKQQPYVKSRDIWGNLYPYDRLITSEGWKSLGDWGARNGVIALGYEEKYGPYRRLAQHAMNYIYSASSAVYSCPVSMTSGAARLFYHQLPGLAHDHPFHEVYRRLTARTENWISSQWMTERPGGSDVQNSETLAVHSPLRDKDVAGLGVIDNGEWVISGYKFFCSATDCDIALMLAKTQSGQLSLFVAPTKRTIQDAEGQRQLVTNGIHFHRLKNKMGTKELPTAELELVNVRAWLVGPLDRGIATIATLLNVTRTHNFVTALSCWRRGMNIAKNFATARTSINQPLWQFPMHLRLLAGMEVKFQGLLQLAFFTTSILSFVDNGFPKQLGSSYAPLPSEGEEAKVVLRTFTATSKAVICKIASIQLQECQEALGGVGYLDEADEPEYNISRLYRDTVANVFWEGTTSVLSSEVVRHLLNGQNLQIFASWMERSISAIKDEELSMPLSASWEMLYARLKKGKGDLTIALADGRQHLFSIASVTCGMLLAHDAQRDNDAKATEIARRWICAGESGLSSYSFADVVHSIQENSAATSSKESLDWDCRIVWDKERPTNSALGYRASAGSAESILQKSSKL